MKPCPRWAAIAVALSVSAPAPSQAAPAAAPPASKVAKPAAKPADKPLAGETIDYPYDGRDVGKPQRAWTGRAFVHERAKERARQWLGDSGIDIKIAMLVLPVRPLGTGSGMTSGLKAEPEACSNLRFTCR